jgi:chromosome segregation ATPase
LTNALIDLNNNSELSAIEKECIQLENMIGTDSLDLETMISEVEMSEKLVANMKADDKVAKIEFKTKAIKSKSKHLRRFIEESRISMKKVIRSNDAAAQVIENTKKSIYGLEKNLELTKANQNEFNQEANARKLMHEEDVKVWTNKIAKCSQDISHQENELQLVKANIDTIEQKLDILSSSATRKKSLLIDKQVRQRVTSKKLEIKIELEAKLKQMDDSIVELEKRFSKKLEDAKKNL